MDIITNQVNFFLKYKPYIHIVLVILIVFLSNLFIRIALSIVNNKLKQRSSVLNIFYSTINKPLRYVTWIIGLWIIFTQIITWDKQNLSSIFMISGMVVEVLVIFCMTWILLSFSKELKQFFIKKNTRTDGGYNDFSMIETIYKAAQVIILIITFFGILNVLHIPVVALASMATVVTGFFAISQQELIKNLFGGTVLYLDRPFSVGDWIYTTSGNIQGIVENISFRLTIIRGFDKRPIYVPNSTFLTVSIVNASRMTNRRILQYVGIRYQDFDKLPQVLLEVHAMLKKHPGIDQKSVTRVCIVNGDTKIGSNIEGCFGAYSINFMIYTFTKTTNATEFYSIQNEIMIMVGQIIKNNGAQIAFPTTTLDLPNDVVQKDMSSF